ncbi:MAG: amidophosphoribosyltransferase [Acidobacteriota bacterium]
MCGIFGIDGYDEASYYTYLGLYALQHRGQESAGMVSYDGQQMWLERGMGYVADLFKRPVLRALQGTRAIGHTRYSTAGSSALANAQPIVVRTAMGPLALVHNGNLVGAPAMRAALEAEGAIFQTTSDTEIILHLMARNPREDVVESLAEALGQVRGAYSLLLLTPRGVIAARDPHGFRPLVMGRRAGHPCFASESCALELLDAVIERELAPGEIVACRPDGTIESRHLPQSAPHRRCAFEHVYFARPDSQVFGASVSRARGAMGERLAEECPPPPAASSSGDAPAIVVPVPDSGLVPALGYSRASGLPIELGLIRNHYVGRTFIQPQQAIRDFGVRVKLSPDRDRIAGRRVVLIDDSIVRGTTSRKIVHMVRDAGALEVHLRISSPPTQWPCHYGIDTPRREELIAAKSASLEEIRQHVEADSLGYLSLEGLLDCLDGDRAHYCTACWTGNYPVQQPSEPEQQQLFPIRTAAEHGDDVR